MVVNKRNAQVKQVLLNVFFILLSILFIIPMWTVVSVSITDNASIMEKGYQLWPSLVSFEAYNHVFRNPETIIRS